ncbi:hypothetical protein [Novosphingopyxis sp.]|uniref:hypothetical protein n=1 Tax=Novosphingopyxis sp. TaxID=2709690 RepID=UPI003B59CC2D
MKTVKRLRNGIAPGVSPVSAARRRSLAKDREIAAVAEDAATFAARDLVEDAEALQIGERRIHGWSG